MSAWVKRLGWRVCIANGLANLRRSPRVNGGKTRQETVSGPKGMGEKTSGIEQAEKRTAGSGNGKKGKIVDNKSSNDGERTIGKSGLDNQTKNS